jgi:hypothetical protein
VIRYVRGYDGIDYLPGNDPRRRSVMKRIRRLAIAATAGAMLALPTAAAGEIRVSVNRIVSLDSSGRVTPSFTVQCDAGDHFLLVDSRVWQYRGEETIFTYWWDWGRFTCTGTPQTFVADVSSHDRFKPGRAYASARVHSFGGCDWTDWRIGNCPEETDFQHADTGGAVPVILRKSKPVQPLN